MQTTESLTATRTTSQATPAARMPPSRWLPRGASGLLPDVVNGIFQGALCIFSAVAYAILIFSRLPGNTLAVGIGVLVTGTCVMCLTLAFLAKVQPVLAGPQDTSSVVFALMATSISAALGPRNPSAILPTMLVLILLSVLALGGTYVLLGTLGLGQVIRYLPYPVIGGFLGGTGWLLVVGSVGIMTPHVITLSLVTHPQTFSRIIIAQLAASVAFALVIFLAQHWVRHPMTIVVTLLIGAAIFYIVLTVLGVSVASARADGWLLGTLPPGHLLNVRWAGALGGADWGQVIDQLGNIFTLVVIGVVAALLNLAGAEVAFGRSANADHELRALGIGGMLTGLVGGVGGYTLLSRSVLAYRGGARSAVVPLVAGLLALATLLGGSVILGLVPRFLLAAVTLYLGASLLGEWLIEKRREMPRAEYAIVVLIVVVIAAAGLFPGVIVGTLAAVMLFAFNYSRSGAIKYAVSGMAYHSTIDRPLNHQRMLRERSEAIHLYELQGYIFFGTSYRILDAIRARTEQSDRTPLRYAILDFRGVIGLDSSASYSFALLRQFTKEHGFMLLYTNLAPPMRALLLPEQQGTAEALADSESANDAVLVSRDVRVFDDIDHALEWCENQLLADTRIGDDHEPLLAQQLASEMHGAYSTEEIEQRLLAHLERTELATGAYLTHEGAVETNIYLISTGRVAVMLTLPDGQQVRLRLMNAGTLIGELSFYRQTPRSASVVALEPTTGYRITWEAIAALQARDPAIVAAFHAYVARVLSERLSVTNDAVAALLR